MISGITYAEAKVFLGTLAMTQPRILALCAMLPLFNRQILPGMLRYALGAAIGIVLVPALAPRYAAMDLGTVEVALIVVKEVFVGMVMGFLVAIPFWIFEAVGFVVDNQRGASLGATINPATGNDSSPMGILFNQAFMVFFLVGGGDDPSVRGLVRRLALAVNVTLLPAGAGNAGSWERGSKRARKTLRRGNLVGLSVEANGKPVSSISGKPSMSARHSTVGPGFAPRTMPVTPVMSFVSR